MKLSACIKSMRLRTLPLSLSGVVMGVFLAYSILPSLQWDGLPAADTSLALSAGPAAVAALPSQATILLLLLTTVLLQILSNLSNELGDTLSGTDRADRAGIHYSLQDGQLSIVQMKRLIAAVASACCLSGLLMVISSIGTIFAPEPVALLLLGAAAIWAAMHYTLGKNPYGYRGKGDLFVFLFFGLVSVCGAFYVCTHTLHPLLLLPAAAIGCFSVGVLNLNNIRDMKSDAATRKTVAIKLGPVRARMYQTALIFLGWTLMLLFTSLYLYFGIRAQLLWTPVWSPWLYLLTFPLYLLHLKGVWTRNERALDPMLPLLVLSTFALSLLAGVGIVIA